MPEIRSDDRVLSLAIPAPNEAAAFGRLLMTGCLVAIGSTDEVNEARRVHSEFDNLMFIAATPDHIPWSDAFFTKILIPPQLQVLLPSIQNELLRVLAPGGEIVSSAEQA
ncbi:MAG TPA: hypothetical protein VN633_13680 [Bryobacteraceae bacterium]|nr:hypothetical protein [Bryobacteraceae bacterium]